MYFILYHAISYSMVNIRSEYSNTFVSQKTSKALYVPV